jgi:hypothetical protein
MTVYLRSVKSIHTTMRHLAWHTPTCIWRNYTNENYPFLSTVWHMQDLHSDRSKHKVELIIYFFIWREVSSTGDSVKGPFSHGRRSSVRTFLLSELFFELGKFHGGNLLFLIKYLCNTFYFLNLIPLATVFQEQFAVYSHNASACPRYHS